MLGITAQDIIRASLFPKRPPEILLTSHKIEYHRGMSGLLSWITQHPALATTALLLIGASLGALAGWWLGTLTLRRRHKAALAHLKRTLTKQGRAQCREHIALLDDLSQTLITTLNYKRVLDLALDVAIQALTPKGEPAIPLVCAVLLFDDQGVLRVASARRFTPADMRASLMATTGVLARVINQRQPLLAREPARDAELRQIIALHAAKSVYLYPLSTGLDVYGLLLYAHPEADYFTPERIDLLEFLGKQATTAIQNARLYYDLEREKQRLTEVEEEARKKLARDLHDGPTQTIAAIAMRVNFIRRLMEKDPKAAAAELAKIEDLARHTTKEIRHLLFTLRPLVLETEGLGAALQAMAEKINQLYNQNVLIEVDPRAVERLDSSQQTTAFAIAEEAVNNARKHANAAHIWVRLKLIRDDIALLEIEDDGVGFNLGSVSSNYEYRGSLGMINMRERAELVSGHIEIHTAEGEGTTIRLWIPLSDNAAERLRQGRLSG